MSPTRPHETDFARLTQGTPASSEATAFERSIAEVASLTAAKVGAREGAAVGARAALDAVAQHLAPTPAPGAPGAAQRASWAGVRHRAAEHLVTLPGQASAATPNGAVDLGPAWVLDLASEWTTANMPVTASTSIVEVDPTRGIPAVPTITTAPTAGPQGGEKTEAYSRAFVVGQAQNATTIDATLVLNWSAQLDASSAAPVGWAMASAAVAAEADRQVGDAIVAQGFAAADLPAALAHFTGQYLPSVLLLPPGGLDALGTMTVTDLTNLGIAVRLAQVTQAVLLAPGAVLGYLAPVTQTKVEPSVLGTSRGWAIFGRVGVDPAGVAVIA